MSDANATPQPPAPPRWPFVCGPTTHLPPGWVRGDPARDSPNQLPVAYDPTRHTVVSVHSHGAAARLTAAGFKPLDAGADPATVLIFVRDRAADATTRRRPPSHTAGRAP